MEGVMSASPMESTATTMKALGIAFLFLATVALSVRAVEAPESQWQRVQLSLIDLVGRGFGIAAVTNDSSPNGVATETFFLQRGENAYKCIEVHTYDQKTKKSAALFDCFELVTPYAMPRAK
jgi:hypothetical protein